MRKHTGTPSPASPELSEQETAEVVGGLAPNAGSLLRKMSKPSVADLPAGTRPVEQGTHTSSGAGTKA